MSIKINSLELENVKKIKAVKVEPTKNGLTVIGGKNNQGKTSVLDAIAWALGGNKQRPSQPNREGSVSDPYLKVQLSNGLIVERKGKNSDLKITDPSGKTQGGQKLLDSFISELALDLPKFMELSSKEKADTLLQIIGVGDQLYKLEDEEKKKYDERRFIGQQQVQKQKYADELDHWPDLPTELVSTSDLIQEQQAILAKNGENQRKRQMASQLQTQSENESYAIEQKKAEIQRLQEELAQMETKHAETLKDVETASKTAQQLQDESTAEIEASLADIDAINEKIRANQNKEAAEAEAVEFKKQYDKLTEEIEAVRQAQMDLLDSADLPLPELSVKDGELIYKGQQWDNMSGSEQLKVTTAIVRKLNPDCGFVLIDKLEQMDLETMQEFGQWLEQEGLQAIATRVSSSGEGAQIIISEGEVVADTTEKDPFESVENVNPAEGWKGGF